MKVEMTPNGVGSAVHMLMEDGLTSLPQAVDKVTKELRKDALLQSDLIPWMVRIAEQQVYQNDRPLAYGNGEAAGQVHSVTQVFAARPSRSLLESNPNDFLVSVPGYGRKRLGDCTRQDVRKVYEAYGSYRKTYAFKERLVKSLWQAMIDHDVQCVEELPVEWARKLIEGKDTDAGKP